MLRGCQSSSAVYLNLVAPLCQIVTFLPDFPSSLNSLALPGQLRGAELQPGASHWARMLPWSTKAVVALSPGYSASGIRPCRHAQAHTHTDTNKYKVSQSNAVTHTHIHMYVEVLVQISGNSDITAIFRAENKQFKKQTNKTLDITRIEQKTKYKWTVHNKINK